MAALACLMLAGIAYAILCGTRPIRLTGVLGQAENRFRSAVTGMLLATEYFLALISAWTALLPLTHPGAGSPSVGGVLALALAFLVAIVLFVVRLGQGGMRAPGSSQAVLNEGGRPVGDRTLDRYWKGGLLYFNSEDPAVFVEKRFGIGYTLNFARPVSWIVLGAVLLVPLAIGLIVKWGSK